MNISPVSLNQSFLQMLQYGGQWPASAYPSLTTQQMITGNTANTTAGLVDSVNYAIPGTNTLTNLLSTSQSTLSNLFDQLA